MADNDTKLPCNKIKAEALKEFKETIEIAKRILEKGASVKEPSFDEMLESYSAKHTKEDIFLNACKHALISVPAVTATALSSGAAIIRKKIKKLMNLPI